MLEIIHKPVSAFDEVIVSLAAAFTEINLVFSIGGQLLRYL